eukprot:7220647-Pyramimonas_sp.AAC.1
MFRGGVPLPSNPGDALGPPKRGVRTRGGNASESKLYARMREGQDVQSRWHIQNIFEFHILRMCPVWQLFATAPPTQSMRKVGVRWRAILMPTP